MNMPRKSVNKKEGATITDESTPDNIILYRFQHDLPFIGDSISNREIAIVSGCVRKANGLFTEEGITNNALYLEIDLIHGDPVTSDGFLVKNAVSLDPIVKIYNTSDDFPYYVRAKNEMLVSVDYLTDVLSYVNSLGWIDEEKFEKIRECVENGKALD